MIQVEVTVEAQGRERRTAQLTGARPLSIGRGPECDIQLDDSRISRRHLLIHVEPGALRVQDISSNGTLAGNRLLRGGFAEVAYGTPILLGMHTVYVRTLAATPPLLEPNTRPTSALAKIVPEPAPA